MSNIVESPKFVCQSCHKVFVRENSYIAHKCSKMKRMEEFKSPVGQRAWQLYEYWLKLKKITADPTNFMASNYFTSFIKFMSFVKKMKIQNPKTFVRFAESKKFPPNVWQNDVVYEQYIEYLDENIAPLEQVQNSINTLFKMANSLDIDVTEVIPTLRPNEILQLIRLRHLSPYLLIKSSQFMNMLGELNDDDMSAFLEVINPVEWAKKLNSAQHITRNIGLLVKEIGI